MRHDDIRRMVLDAHDRASAVCDRLKPDDSFNEDEIAAYRGTLEATAEFWRSASPAFIHAWFVATSAEAEERGS